jgi:hypothetical protein
VQSLKKEDIMVRALTLAHVVSARCPVTSSILYTAFRKPQMFFSLPRASVVGEFAFSIRCLRHHLPPCARDAFRIKRRSVCFYAVSGVVTRRTARNCVVSTRQRKEAAGLFHVATKTNPNRPSQPILLTPTLHITARYSGNCAQEA